MDPKRRIFLFHLLSLLLVPCGMPLGAGSGGVMYQKKEKIMDTITVSSTAFNHHESIPALYTCDGENVSPPLAWKGIPAAALSIAVICDDPDAPAGTWVHWVVYDLPPTADSLSERIRKNDSLPGGAKQGITDFRQTGYGGPCPPSGTHRYYFKAYALDTMLNLPAGKSKKEIERAMQGHVIGYGELVGKYSRKK
jgi:Raf kinase inhibitor-like YbhB/YbcL family protein